MAVVITDVAVIVLIVAIPAVRINHLAVMVVTIIVWGVVKKMTNVNYDIELLNSVVSSGSVSYESVGNQQFYACDDCYGGCAGNCEDNCGSGCEGACADACTGTDFSKVYLSANEMARR